MGQVLQVERLKDRRRDDIRRLRLSSENRTEIIAKPPAAGRHIVELCNSSARVLKAHHKKINPSDPKTGIPKQLTSNHRSAARSFCQYGSFFGGGSGIGSKVPACSLDFIRDTTAIERHRSEAAK